MRYIVIIPGEEVFQTNWFSPENFADGMTVIDTQADTYTTDGRNWLPVQYDTL